MKYWLATVKHGDGSRPVLVIDEKAMDLRKALALAPHQGLGDVFDGWESFEPMLSKIADAGDGWEDWMKLAPLAPLDRPRGLYCAGANYSDHVSNMAKARGIPDEPDPHDLGMPPWFFVKTASSIVGDGAEIELDCEFLDWEAELAVVIGRPARRVSEADALSHIAGYTIANDLSARDRITRKNGQPGTTFFYDWVGQKVFNGSCPLGPFILPAQFVADPQNIDIKLWVNDKLRINSNTSRMLFSIAEQISALSHNITLHPGDIILTGTPAGVGAETGESLSRGDRVRIAMEGLGEQTVKIV
jgi:2-keto-4-pentenoate hydratase/2-oxohepta-3-ene-1,7-dioic acid hydratase in catechol pathway